MDFNELLVFAKQGAENAAKAILEVYHSGDFSVEAKSDDSPLTKADRAGHLAIVAELEKTGLPILSEEGRAIAYQERKNWEYFWMIDPLDGTKEFIKKNGEFTVNIALIHNNRAIMGVVLVPVSGELYYSIDGQGAFKTSEGNTQKLSVNQIAMTDNGLKVVASRSHMSEETQQFVDQLDQPSIVSKGSSLKLLMIAEGSADLYPRYAPTMEWDTAAAQAIVEAAGGKVLQSNSDQNVVYNKENLLNPHFLVLPQLGE